MWGLLTQVVEILVYVGGAATFLLLACGYVVHRFRVATNDPRLLKVQWRLLVAFFVSLAVMVLLAVAVFALREKEKEQLTAELNQRMPAVIDQVRGLADPRKEPLAESQIPALDQVLIWDLFSNQLSGAHVRLPRSLRATSADRPVTILLVSRSSSPRPLNPDDVEIRLVSWPQKQVLGRYDFYQRRYAPDFEAALGIWVQSIATRKK